MILRIDHQKPDERRVKQVIDCLKNDGIIIYPTDTVYTLGCSIQSKKAFEKLCRFKGIKPEKANFSIVCKDLSHLSEMTKSIDNATYRFLKNILPGPYTVILPASKQMSSLFGHSKKTVGIRVPDSRIDQAIIEQLGHPLFSTSMKNEDDNIQDYYTDPWEMEMLFADFVDLIIDGGAGDLVPSTVLDLSGEEAVVVREGKGSVDV